MRNHRHDIIKREDNREALFLLMLFFKNKSLYYNKVSGFISR